MAEISEQTFEYQIRSSRWLQDIPFDHLYRDMPHERFMNRLMQEQWLFANGKFSTLPSLSVIIFYDNDDPVRFENTLESCLLQSVSLFNIFIIVSTHESQAILKERIEERLNRSAYLRDLFGEKINCCRSLEEYSLQKKSGCGDFVLFIKDGDILHPSYISSFYLELWNMGSADIYTTNEVIIDYLPAVRVNKFIRKPLLEKYTLFHFNYISYNFIIKAVRLLDFPDFERHFRGNDCHLFLLEILDKDNIIVVNIPQYLFLKDSANIKKNSDYFDRYRKEYESSFAKHDFSIQLLEGPTPYRLVPNKLPNKLSVIIPFRDKPQITCDAVESLLNQTVKFKLEIILINNQSTLESIQQIKDFIATRCRNQNIKVVDYNHPFNHSAQCNLGVKESEGDCVLFFNNDARLISHDALSQMAVWSLVPGIGTVGIRLVNKDNGGLVCAGIATRPNLGPEFRAVVEESKDQEFALFNRDVWGNTFACAAISRKVYDMVGQLDEINFPIGYNDVDFNMRCRKLGLTNIFLGTVTAVHMPGTSRKPPDEIYEKILLRRMYPEFLNECLFQLQSEIKKIKPTSSREFGHSPKKQPEPPVVIKSLTHRFIIMCRTVGLFSALSRVIKYIRNRTVGS